MRFYIVNKVSFEYGNIANIVNEISEECGNFFDGRSYGSDIKEIIVCVIMITPEFDFFFKTRDPLYTKGKKNVIVEGVDVFLDNTLQVDIKLNNLEVTIDKQDLKALLFAKIFEAIDKYKRIDRLDFNKNLFALELKECFLSNLDN